VGPIDPKKWNEFAANLYYQEGEYGNAEDFKKLAQRLDDLSAEKKTWRESPVLSFHSARSLPAHCGAIGACGIGEACLRRMRGCASLSRSRSVRDLASARELNKKVLCVFDEQQVYRIDHYLGKDTVAKPFGVALQQRDFSSRCGTAITLTTCRSRRRRLWVWNGAADFTKRLARCAT